MSNPQTEDGYTRIANELLDAIVQFDFSKRQYAVVLAVIRMTYGYNKKSDALSIWQISGMTNIDRSHASKAVAELVAMGVLIKSENGRFAHGQIVPELSLNKHYKKWDTDAETAQVQTDAETAQVQTDAETAQVQTDAETAQVQTDAETAPVPKQHQCQNSPQTDAETATPPVPKQHTHKDIPKDIPKDSKNILPPADEVLVFPPEISEQLKNDFLTLRKAKKAPVTQTAINGIIREAKKAGMTLEAALEMCCSQGWQGFKASWLANNNQPRSGAPPASNGKQAARDSYAAQAAEARERMQRNEQPSTIDITGECQRVA